MKQMLVLTRTSGTIPEFGCRIMTFVENLIRRGWHRGKLITSHAQVRRVEYRAE